MGDQFKDRFVSGLRRLFPGLDVSYMTLTVGSILAITTLSSLYMLGFFLRIDRRLYLLIDSHFRIQLFFDLAVSAVGAAFITRYLVGIIRFMIVLALSIPILIVDIVLLVVRLEFLLTLRAIGYGLQHKLDEVVVAKPFLHLVIFAVAFALIHFPVPIAISFCINSGTAFIGCYMLTTLMSRASAAAKRYAAKEPYRLRLSDFTFSFKDTEVRDVAYFIVLLSGTISVLGGYQEAAARVERAQPVYLNGEEIYLVGLTSSGLIFIRDKPMFDDFGDVAKYYEEWNFQVLDATTELSANRFPEAE